MPCQKKKAKRKKGKEKSLKNRKRNKWRKADLRFLRTGFANLKVLGHPKGGSKSAWSVKSPPPAQPS